MKYGDIMAPGDLFSERPKIKPITYHNNLLLPENKHVLTYLIEERKLSRETIQNFLLGADDRGNITIPFFREGQVVNYKFRGVKEKTFSQFNKGENWVVNEKALEDCKTAGYLIITEGEFDAMAVWQIGLRAVISANEGASGRKLPWIVEIPDEVETVYINCDNDEPGQKYARELAERIGIERCKNVILPTKDANDFVRKAYSEGLTNEQIKAEFAKIMDTAPRFPVKDVLKMVDVIEELKNNPIERIPTFLDRLNDNTKGGIPRKSMVVVTAESGIGKSTLLMNLLVGHADLGHPVLLISLENDMHFTIQRLLEIKFGFKWGKTLQQFTEDDWNVVKDELIDYPFYIDVSMNTYTMKKVRKVVEQAKKMYGIEFMGFDHIGFLPNRVDHATAELAQMSRDFKILSVEEDVVVYVISHLRRRQQGQKYISGDDIKGTSSLKQDADMVWLIIPVGKDQFVINIDKARMSRSKINIPIVFSREYGVVIDDNTREVTDLEGEKVLEEVKIIPPMTAHDIEQMKEEEGMDIDTRY